ncbi:MAG TPA: condensation domain-containing protein, partial [Pyrinomonadaceae bacterium]|nr:condensation domain-containing protein [Pyrinomonadaceae bacterium]
TTEETYALLRQIPTAYRAHIDDILLTALASAFSGFADGARLLVDLESHGREELFEGVDVSRTIGWFTSIYPVPLPLEERGGAEAVFESVRRSLRRIPQPAVSYGLLRYLSHHQSVREHLAAHPRPEVSFNDLGQIDQLFPASSQFRLAHTSAASARDPRGMRRYLFDINASVTQGQLRVEWTYSANLHRRATVEELSHRFVEALRSLIAHGKSSRVVSVTPADFPLAQLTPKQLDLLRETYGQPEDIYQLSPLQHGMLYHSLYSPESGVYLEQLSFKLNKDLNVPAFERAWQSVVQRHGVLRTVFVWEDLGEPLQVVLPQVGVNVRAEDWRDLPPGEQGERLAELIREDRDAGFALSTAPLMRLRLIRLSDETSQFIWSYHHILLDGWCMPLILKEVLTIYSALCAGQDVELPSPRPYHDYIAWLQEQDVSEAKAFWQHTLAGFTAPTPLDLGRPAARRTGDGDGYAQRRMRLSADETAALQAVARSNQLTLNTLLQGMWSLLLHCYSGERDVIFGIALSGRPASLTGVESMIGLFINTLPLRVEVPAGAKLLPWLKELQLKQVELSQYEYSSLVQVQSWSEVGRGLPLFESILAFENYPVDASLLENAGGFITDLHFFERANYPLALVVVPGQELLLQVAYDQNRFDDAAVTQLMEECRTLLGNMVVGMEGEIDELPALIEAKEHRRAGAQDEAERSAPVTGAHQQPLKNADAAIHPAHTQDAQQAAQSIAAADQSADELEMFGLTSAQKRFWLLSQREAGGGLHNLIFALRLDGRLDIPTLERSLQALADRQQILQARFACVDGEPLQIINPPEPVELYAVDLRRLSEEEQKAEVAKRVENEARQSFDPARGPLWQTSLLRVKSNEHILLVTMHPLVADRWSFEPLLRQLAALYEAFSREQPSPLPPLPVQYVDEAQRQQQWMADDGFTQQLAYWKQRLGGSLPVLQLPTTQPPPTAVNYQRATAQFSLSSGLLESLRELSRAEDVELATTLLAVWQTFLHRYTGEEDIILGTVVKGRQQAGTEDLIGAFENTLILRTPVVGELTLRELLRRTHEVTSEAHKYQDVPYEKLLEELHPDDDAELCQVGFLFEEESRAALDAGSVRFGRSEVESLLTRFNLTLRLDGEGHGALEYDAGLFDLATVRRMIVHFQMLLESAAANPEGRISLLPLLTESERQRMLFDWNDTASDEIPVNCIHKLFEAQARRTPENVAVIYEDEQLSYRELDRRANQLANYLRELGVGPEVLVGICMNRSLEMIVSLLAILKAGGAYVPLDPHYPRERLLSMLDDAGLPLLLTQRALIEQLRLPVNKTICVDAQWEEIAGRSEHCPEVRVLPENLAYMIYTSGSTGKPKGAMLQHDGLCNVMSISLAAFGMNEKSRVLQFASFSF